MSPTGSHTQSTCSNRAVAHLISRKTGSIPILIVELLCIYIKDYLNVSESFVGLPILPLTQGNNSRVVYTDNDTRELLLALALVHPSWTKLARRAMRTRLSINIRMDPRRFERSNFCGPWIREIQLYDESRLPLLRSKEGDRLELREPHEAARVPWLALIKHFPNLRALALCMGEVGLSLECLARNRNMDSSLTSLHVQAQIWHADTLIGLRILVAQLQNLTTLSIIGDNFKDKPVDRKLVDALQEYVPPPSSLKRLLIEFQSDVQRFHTFLPHITWFLQARERFTLEALHLYVRHDFRSIIGSLNYDTVDHLLPAMESTLPRLKTLDVRIWGGGTSKLISFTPNLIRTLGSRCPNLEELHVDIFKMKTAKDMPDFPLTLKKLHVFTTIPKRSQPAADDWKLAEMLRSALVAGELPNLQEVCFTDFNSGVLIWSPHHLEEQLTPPSQHT